MATMLLYVMQDRRTSGQAEILADFRSNDEIRRLFDDARREREAFLTGNAAAVTGN
jgi:hypothetical protein